MKDIISWIHSDQVQLKEDTTKEDVLEYVKKIINLKVPKNMSEAVPVPHYETKEAVWYIICEPYYVNKEEVLNKILSVPFKYAEVPRIYEKPLYILCIGGPDKFGKREGIFNPVGPEKEQILQFFSTLRIFFVSCSKLFKDII